MKKVLILGVLYCYDRDRLIRLETKVKYLQRQIDDLKTLML